MLCIDSTYVKVHPYVTGALKKTDTKHRTFKRGVDYLCSSSSKFALIFHLSAGNTNDAPEGRKVIRSMYLEDKYILIALIADRAYEDAQTRKLMKEQGFILEIPPKKNRKHSWKNDQELYKSRNEYRTIIVPIKEIQKSTRYDQLDIIFITCHDF